MTTTDHATLTALGRLESSIAGAVVGRDHADYDSARQVVMGSVDRHPIAVVRVADVDDVRRVVRFAADTGVELAVRSGGHSGAGHGTTEGGVVLDLAGLKSMEVDPEGRTAWAGSGLTAGEFTVSAGRHGLATPFGDTASVGIGGITLAGGIGYLVRKFGLTIDSLLAAEVVTATGELIHVDAENHPDLFWALRGGGGNFGVVTRFKYRLHEVPEVVGGMLLLPATADVIGSFLALADEAPEELSVIANVMPAPPMPFVPAEHHGKLVVMALMTYAGSAADAEPVLAPFRRLATPLADLLRPMPYAEIYPPDPEGYRPIAAARTLFRDRVDRDTAAAILDRVEEHVATTNAQMAAAQLRPLGGAMARVDADATAFAHRSSPMMVNVATMVGSVDDLEAHVPWVEEVAASLRTGDAAYAGFLADEGEARVRAAYPDRTWDRLADVKRRYDPDNLFRLNQNVPPAST